MKKNALFIFLSGLALAPLMLILPTHEEPHIMIQLSFFFSFLGMLSTAFYLTLSYVFKETNKMLAYGLAIMLLFIQLLLALDMAFDILELA